MRGSARACAGTFLRVEPGAPTTTRIELRDDRVALIAQLGPADRERYLTGMQRAGPEALYKRFMTPVSRLTESQFRYLLEIDHRDHEALMVVDEDSGEAVAVGRFVRLTPASPVAEVAVLVIDDWQGIGLGKALCHLLADRAVELGIERFEATVLMDNRPMLALLESIGSPRTVGRDGASVMLEVTLPGPR